MVSALARELRENCVYLEDDGWHYTGQLMKLAADEIDRLESEVERLRRVDRSTEIARSLSRPHLGTKVRNIVARILVGR
jgi:hypothetical protein